MHYSKMVEHLRGIYCEELRRVSFTGQMNCRRNSVSVSNCRVKAGKVDLSSALFQSVVLGCAG